MMTHRAFINETQRNSDNPPGCSIQWNITSAGSLLEYVRESTAVRDKRGADEGSSRSACHEKIEWS